METLLREIVSQNERILGVLEDIKTELQWHKELSAVAQIIEAINNVSTAVHSVGLETSQGLGSNISMSQINRPANKTISETPEVIDSAAKQGQYPPK